MGIPRKSGVMAFRTFPAGLAVLATLVAPSILFTSGGLPAQETEEILSYDVVVEVMDGGTVQG